MGNTGNKNPVHVTVNIIAHGHTIASATLSEDNSWTYTFTGLPKHDENKEIIHYRVDEITIPEGYTATYSGNMHNGFTITNTYEYEEVEENKETVNITVHKVWENNGHKIPDSITVSLMANGQHITSTKLSAGNRWTHTFSNLDKYGANGKQIVYTIDEIRIPEGYMVDYTGNMKEGFIITNTYPLNDSVKVSINFHCS
ncbi:Cna B-type domain-containing protein [Methanosphaera sp. ISO3-F5]|uniref:Cna B-type domain-containing protein n=1 Tax=Methanosphaera sp. ISO3-F5 TaxID=1452353 RepID=UPI002B25B003|nr:Cna B-type domain-containing protein [Methanosphaera sp. ISO3-F5]WQH63615.1 Cna B-type domain-containing protein [Methanosphaera sp. ISO3-F5]